MKLLERDALLAALQEQLQRAAAGPGMLVFLEGEAGIGKTSVLRAFADRQRGALPLRWGACDALNTPRPLGPLYDIAAQAAEELRVALESDGERQRVFGAFFELLATRTSVVLLEDLHWADEATLDLLRFIGRRVGRTRSLIVGSFAAMRWGRRIRCVSCSGISPPAVFSGWRLSRCPSMPCASSPAIGTWIFRSSIAKPAVIRSS